MTLCIHALLIFGNHSLCLSPIQSSGWVWLLRNIPPVVRLRDTVKGKRDAYLDNTDFSNNHYYAYFPLYCSVCNGNISKYRVFITQSVSRLFWKRLPVWFSPWRSFMILMHTRNIVLLTAKQKVGSKLSKLSCSLLNICVFLFTVFGGWKENNVWSCSRFFHLAALRSSFQAISKFDRNSHCHQREWSKVLH